MAFAPHEVNKIESLDDDDIRAMISDDLVCAHRGRGLSPDNPFIRGTAQNPDVYFRLRGCQSLLSVAARNCATGDGSLCPDQRATLSAFDYVAQPMPSAFW